MATRTVTRKRPATEEEPRPTQLRRLAAAAAEEEEEDQAAVTDDEVEEFFAILQRMREATRLFAASGGGEGKAKAAETMAPQRPCPASRWRPAFEQEDFKEASASAFSAAPEEDPGRRRARSSTNSAGADAAAEDGSRGRFLDLNAEPATEE